MAFDRAHDRIAAAARRGSDLVTFWREVAPTLRRGGAALRGALLLHRRPGVAADHQSLPGGPAGDPRGVARPGVRRARLQLDGRGVSPHATGSAPCTSATGGRPELARKYHEEMLPFGCEQELVLALRTRDGETWGAVGLYRETGPPLFVGRRQGVPPRRGTDAGRGRAPRAAPRRGRASRTCPDAPGAVVPSTAAHAVSSSPSPACRCWPRWRAARRPARRADRGRRSGLAAAYEEPAGTARTAAGRRGWSCTPPAARTPTVATAACS